MVSQCVQTGRKRAQGSICAQSLFASKILIPAAKNLLFRLKCGIMHRIVEDKAIPKKQGELPTVPTQPPHHVPSQKSQNPHPPSPPIHYSLPTIHYSHETNPISTQPTANRQKPKAIFAKRTQFATHPHHPPTQKYETNPISAAADLWRTKYAKRTQFPTTNIHSTIYSVQYTIPPMANLNKSTVTTCGIST